MIRRLLAGLVYGALLVHVVRVAYSLGYRRARTEYMKATVAGFVDGMSINLEGRVAPTPHCRVCGSDDIRPDEHELDPGFRCHPKGHVQ